MEVSTAPQTGGGGAAAAEEYSGGRNRWPSQEAVALLRIRSEMDASFKDSGLRGPLWEEISRRMSELGFSRSAKKCKEKFENIQKYHKRTKEGRSRRQNGKSYKFFQQLEAIDRNSHNSRLAKVLAADSVNQTSGGGGGAIDATPCSVYSPVRIHFLDSTSTSTTSITPSKEEEEEEEEESEGTKKKKKLTEFFDSLMARVIEKQESLQRNFAEAVERFERDRMARDEAWKLKELERIKRERELLIRERETVAAKDAAVLSFLQKFTNQPGSFPLPLPLPIPERQTEKLPIRKIQTNAAQGLVPQARWPKEEIEALIKVRTSFEVRYQGHGPKGPLWIEVSADMRRLGYNRNPKRCKEKWENMNKYFKRVKESRSSKARPVDSKTCPYFHQLDALYSGKRTKPDSSANSGGSELKPEELLMHMIRRQEELQHPESATTDDGGEKLNAEEKEESDGYRNNPTATMEQSPERDDRRGSYLCQS